MTDEVQVRVTADTQDAEAGMKRAGEAVHDSVEHMKEGFEGVSATFDELKEKFSTALEITGIAIAIEALDRLKEALDEVAVHAVHLEHTSEMIGVSSKELQGLHAAAEEAGVGTDKMDSGLLRLSIKLQEARDGSQQMRDKLAAVGVTLEDLANGSFTVVSAMEKLTESAASNDQKMAVLGARNLALISAFKELEDSQQSAIDKANELGALSTEQVETLKEYHKAMADLSIRFENFGAGIAVEVIPMVMRLMDTMGELWHSTLSPLIDAIVSGTSYVIGLGKAMLGSTATTEGWEAALQPLLFAVRTLETVLVLAATAASLFGSVIIGVIKEAVEFVAKLTHALVTLFDDPKQALVEFKSAFSEVGSTLSSTMDGWNTQANKLAETLHGIWTEKKAAEKETEVIINVPRNPRNAIANNDGDLIAQIEKESFATQNMMDKHHFAYTLMKEDLKNFNAAAKDYFKEEERRLKDSDSMNQFHAEQYYKSLAEMTKGFQTVLSPIGNAFQTSINGMIQGTQTFAQAFGKMGQAILGDFISLTVHMAEKWAAKELAQTAMTQEHSFLRSALIKLGLIEEVAAQGTATAATVATKGIEADAVVTANASEAASGAAASVASIPYVGWAMAAGVFAATLSMVLSAKHSAAGGFDVPSGVNPVTQLHSEEMVLPAPIANTVREAMSSHSSGGASRSGGGSFNLNTTGSGDYFMIHRRDLLNAFRQMQREGRVPM